MYIVVKNKGFYEVFIPAARFKKDATLRMKWENVHNERMIEKDVMEKLPATDG